METLEVQRQIRDILDRLERLEKPDQDGVAVSYTPTYDGATPGTTTYAANGQVGHYVRFGPLVFFYGRIQWTAATGTGDAHISIPVTAAATTNLNSTVAVAINNVTYTQDAPTGLVGASAAYFDIRSPITNAGATIVQVEAAGVINFSGFYEAA